jgi:hypothetical protein
LPVALLSERAATKAADAGIEGRHAGMQRGERVGQRLTVGVVEVQGDAVGADARVAERTDERADVPAVPTRWCRRG